MKFYRRILVLIFCACTFSTVEAASGTKTIIIEGLELHTSEELMRNTFGSLKTTLSAEVAAQRIRSRLHSEGFYLASCHLLEETPESIHLFVDEGHLGQIVFLKLDTLQVIKQKLSFKLPKRIYNIHTVEEQLKLIRKNEGLIAEAKLVESENFNNYPFQISRDIWQPTLGTTNIPFTRMYNYRYRLEISIINTKEQQKKSLLMFGLKSSYTKGFIPYITLKKRSLLGNDDTFQIKSSVGIYYLFDLKPKNPPHWTFMEAETSYSPPRFIDKVFSPRAKGTIYRSKAERKDLNINEYEYLILRGTLEPGFAFARYFHAYFGLGIEKDYFYNSPSGAEALSEQEKKNSNFRWIFYKTSIEGENLLFKNQRSPFTLDASYTFYKNNTSFHEFSVLGDFNRRFASFYHYSAKAEYAKAWGIVPFNHETSVYNNAFKGLQGKSFYSKNLIKESNSIKVSIHKDYVYAGVFADIAIFNGAGHNISGWHQALCAGPSIHFVLYDQFNFDFFAGKDFLVSTRESAWCYSFNFYKSF